MTPIPTARERIARIIDPEAWQIRDTWIGETLETISQMERGRVAAGMPTLEDRCAPSLAKADLILSDRAGEGGGAAFDADRPEALAWGLSMLAQMMTERPLTETERVDAANNLLGPASRKLQRLTPSPTGFTEEEITDAQIRAAYAEGMKAVRGSTGRPCDAHDIKFMRAYHRALGFAPHPSREGEG